MVKRGIVSDTFQERDNKMRGVRVTTSNEMDLHCKDYKNKLKNQFNEINESSAVASRPK